MPWKGPDPDGDQWPTLGHEVVDVFYVNRIHDLEVVTELSGDLRLALER